MKGWVGLGVATAWWDFLAVKRKSHPTLSSIIRRLPDPVKWLLLGALWHHFIKTR